MEMAGRGCDSWLDAVIAWQAFENLVIQIPGQQFVLADAAQFLRCFRTFRTTEAA